MGADQMARSGVENTEDKMTYFFRRIVQLFRTQTELFEPTRPITLRSLNSYLLSRFQDHHAWLENKVVGTRFDISAIPEDDELRTSWPGDWIVPQPNFDSGLWSRSYPGDEFNPLDLRHANFSGSDLRWSDLYNVDFRNADLTGVNFQNCNLVDVDFKQANLTEANFENCNLVGVDLGDANLSNTSFHGARLENVNMSDAAVTNMRFGARRVVQLQARRVDFSQQVLELDAIHLAQSDIYMTKLPDVLEPGRSDVVSTLDALIDMSARQGQHCRNQFRITATVAAFMFLAAFINPGGTIGSEAIVVVFGLPIPISAILMGGPIILTAFLIYLMIQLTNLARTFRMLPRCLPDGRTLFEIDNYWILRGFALPWVPTIRSQISRQIVRSERGITYLLIIGYFGVLLQYWWVGLSFQNPILTLVHVICLFTSSSTLTAAIYRRERYLEPSLQGRLTQGWFALALRSIFRYRITTRIPRIQRFIWLHTVIVGLFFAYWVSTVPVVEIGRVFTQPLLNVAILFDIGPPSAVKVIAGEKLERIKAEPDNCVVPDTKDAIHAQVVKRFGTAKNPLDRRCYDGVDFSRSGFASGFRRANFSNISARFGRFDEIDVSNATFIKARLSCSCFNNATVHGTDFSGAELQFGSFNRVSAEPLGLIDGVTEVKIGSDVNCEDSSTAGRCAPQLGRPISQPIWFKSADATGASFYRAMLAKADFTGATLQATRFLRANLTEAIFTNATLDGAQMQGMSARKANFDQAVFLINSRLGFRILALRQ